MANGPTVTGTMRGGITSVEEVLDYTYTRDIRSPDVHSTFIRLVRPGEQTPALTYEAECTVDVDGNGRVIGVTIHTYDEEFHRW